MRKPPELENEAALTKTRPCPRITKYDMPFHRLAVEACAVFTIEMCSLTKLGAENSDHFDRIITAIPNE